MDRARELEGVASTQVMQTPKTSPNLPLGTAAFWINGIFWLVVGELYRHYFVTGTNVSRVTPPAPPSPWWQVMISVPIWVILISIVVGLVAAYWNYLFWMFRWWVPYTIDALLAPKTFRSELLGLSKMLKRLATSKGRLPTPQESAEIAQSYYNSRYSAHVMCARKKLRKVPVVQNSPLLDQWFKLIPMGADDVQMVGEYLEQLAWLVPNDVLPLTRPAIGEDWHYQP